MLLLVCIVYITGSVKVTFKHLGDLPFQDVLLSSEVYR